MKFPLSPHKSPITGQDVPLHRVWTRPQRCPMVPFMTVARTEKIWGIPQTCMHHEPLFSCESQVGELIVKMQIFFSDHTCADMPNHSEPLKDEPQVWRIRAFKGCHIHLAGGSHSREQPQP